jgi:hypothetical protein
MIRFVSASIAALALFAAQGADAQFQASDARRSSVKGGLGFTADPDTFLLGFEFDRPLQQQISLVGRLELGLEDDLVLLSPTLGARYWFDLTRTNLGGLRPLRPYVNGGMGLSYFGLDENRDDKVGFLVALGFGAEWPLTRQIALGTDMRFNIIPVGADGENFYFAWEVLGMRYRF